MRKSLITLLGLGLLLAACGKDAESIATEQKKGREETKNIRATEAVGYSGGAIANKVDATLNANDQRVQTLDQKAAAAGEGAPPQ